MDHFLYREGILHAEGVPLPALADRLGTPAFVYSAGTLRDHYRRVVAAFAPLDPLVCYSVKSCSNIHVCRTLALEGAGMDVVSGGELERAWLAGVPMDKVVYAGVGKSDAEIRAALDGSCSPLAAWGWRPVPPPGDDAGAQAAAIPEPAALGHRGPIGWFNIESEPEFEVIAAIARSMRVAARGALRVNPDVDPRTHAHTSTGRKDSKFGVDLARAEAFFRRYGRDEWLRLRAIHLHIGSPVYETAPYAEAVAKALGLIERLEREEGGGFRIDMLDLGGGFGADYETHRTPALTDYAAAIVPLLRPRVARGLKVVIEPGRVISANAGVLLTRVLYVKQGAGGKRFVICDAGMNALIRPALYGAFHFAWPAAVAPHHVPARRAPELDMPGLELCDIVGPICESADFLARDRRLPPVARGDLIAVFGAGAYAMSMASTYNSHPLPAEALVDGTSWRVVRPRQTLCDLLGPELAGHPDAPGTPH